MDQKTLKELKKQLEEKRIDVIKQLESIGVKVEGGAETNFNAEFPDYGNSASVEDNASEVADYTTNLSLERDLEDELRGVDKALKRMEDGTYGKCNYCHKDIEVQRLKIRPESTACVTCKNTLKGKG
ncbi:MAG: TraR/DksA C4-type zinc finger protein [Patescibacteria group bacterium]